MDFFNLVTGVEIGTSGATPLVIHERLGLVVGVQAGLANAKAKIDVFVVGRKRRVEPAQLVEHLATHDDAGSMARIHAARVVVRGVLGMSALAAKMDSSILENHGARRQHVPARQQQLRLYDSGIRKPLEGRE
jgi:hypothetical protein